MGTPTTDIGYDGNGGLASARRLYLHARATGELTLEDIGRMVEWMERLQRQRDQLIARGAPLQTALTEILGLLAPDTPALIPGLAEAAVAAVQALKTTHEELEQTFRLAWDADMRAIEAWQQAHPGNDLTWPDRSAHAYWILDCLDIARTALDKLARLGNGDSLGTSDGNRIAQDALAAMGLEAK